ncbi:unnamed protein product, partial [Owenia fusiformis]
NAFILSLTYSILQEFVCLAVSPMEYHRLFILNHENSIVSMDSTVGDPIMTYNVYFGVYLESINAEAHILEDGSSGLTHDEGIPDPETRAPSTMYMSHSLLQIKHIYLVYAEKNSTL